MKKYINIALLALVALTSISLSSCKNEVDEIFDKDPVTRLAEAKAQYTDILTSNGGKWQLEYYANTEEPGYIYLMTFKKDGSVTISGMNKWISYIINGTMNAPAFGSDVSMWDVITDNGPVLSLNTYNKYFHLFADPYDIPSSGSTTSDTDVNENGYGHEGNYEFDIMKYSGDTLYLTGKKPTQNGRFLNMIMTRVAENIDDEVYMNEVTAMADSFFNAKVPQVYINLPNGVRWIVKEGATSILKMFREDADEISTSEKHNVIITHDGLSFMDPINLDGYIIQNFVRQSDGSLLCRDDNQTTMTADKLSNVFSSKNLVWRSDLSDVGGAFSDLVAQIGQELKDYNKSTLMYAQLAYNADSAAYALSFNVKKGSVRYNPTYFMTMTVKGDNKISFTVEPVGDKMGETYATKCPSMRAFADRFAAEYDLSATSVLAPVYMKMSNGGNYIVWTMQ